MKEGRERGTCERGERVSVREGGVSGHTSGARDRDKKVRRVREGQEGRES